MSTIYNSGTMSGFTFTKSDDVDLVQNVGTMTRMTFNLLGGNDRFEGIDGIFDDSILDLGAGNDWAQVGEGDNSIFGGVGNDRLYGGKGYNTLDGGTGADYLAGGWWNDIYVVDNLGDRVVEPGSASAEDDLRNGRDTVKSYIDFNLSPSTAVTGKLEDLTLIGTGAISGTGNGLANTLIGNAAANGLVGLDGNDRLAGRGGNDSLKGGNGDDILNGETGNDIVNGGAGRDTLAGSTGNDAFVFNAAVIAANADRITDFNVAADTIRLDNAVMAALGATVGALTASMFWKSAAGVAHDATDRIIYDTDSGAVFYDANGNGAGGSVLLVTLSANLALSQADFIVI